MRTSYTAVRAARRHHEPNAAAAALPQPSTRLTDGPFHLVRATLAVVRTTEVSPMRRHRTRLAAVASRGAAKVRLWARSHPCLARASEHVLCARAARPSSCCAVEIGLDLWLYLGISSASTR